MTTELFLCLVFMFAAYPVSKSIASHYFIFTGLNVLAIGVESADSSLLAITFALLAIADVSLVIAGGWKVLLVSAVASVALCIESMMNMDWLLSHSTYINAAVNAVIAASLVKGFMNWTHGR